MTVKHNCRIIVTSGVGHQLSMFEEHLFSLLKGFHGWEPKVSVNELWAPAVLGQRNKCKWFTTERGGLAKGQHSVVQSKVFDADQIEDFAKDGGTIILIRDECGEIPQEMKDSQDTYGANFIFNFGNSTKAMGWWYDLFEKFSALYECMVVTAYESSYWTP